MYSGQKHDPHKYPSQGCVIYKEELKSGYCDTFWILSSDSNSNNSPYQERSSSTLTKKKNIIYHWWTWFRINKTLSGACTKTLTQKNFPLKWYQVLHQEYKSLILLLVGSHKAGAIDYGIGHIIRKPNKLLLDFLFFPILVFYLKVITPCIISIISINTPFFIIIFVFQGGCCQKYRIWNNRLFGDPFWKIPCWPLR